MQIWLPSMAVFAVYHLALQRNRSLASWYETACALSSQVELRGLLPRWVYSNPLRRRVRKADSGYSIRVLQYCTCGTLVHMARARLSIGLSTRMVVRNVERRRWCSQCETVLVIEAPDQVEIARFLMRFAWWMGIGRWEGDSDAIGRHGTLQKMGAWGLWSPERCLGATRPGVTERIDQRDWRSEGEQALLVTRMGPVTNVKSCCCSSDPRHFVPPQAPECFALQASPTSRRPHLRPSCPLSPKSSLVESLRVSAMRPSVCCHAARRILPSDAPQTSKQTHTHTRHGCFKPMWRPQQLTMKTMKRGTA